MPFVRHQSRPIAITAPAPRPRKNSRGNSLSPDPGKGRVSSPVNCHEIDKACDAFLAARVPGYVITNFMGRRPTRATAVA
jgi:hypothetical protein